MIVIWEKFVKVWTNFGNLIKNFKSFKENFESYFKKILIKILKNLTKIWNFSFYRFSFFQLWKICVRGNVPPGFTLEPLLYMLIQKFGGGGKTHDRIMFKN